MRAIAAILLWSVALPAAAEGPRGPALAAASNYGQGWQPEMFATATAHGIDDFRDAVYWDRVERPDGRHVFDRPTTTWPDALAATGAGTSLTVNNGHPAHDGGVTPHSPGAVAAFAAHAAATVARFPAIHSVEVGNEFNSLTFTSGPVREAALPDRAAAYMALLKATHDAVAEVDPDIRILGGGVHSIPAGYLRMLFDLGAAAYMDALALHPYTTPPEQLVRQVAVLHRQVPQAARLPIEATEFGSTDPADAPRHLLKSYCQMALAGVTRAVWYPLNDRGDGLVPLIDRSLGLTDAGRAFLTIRAELEGRPVADRAPDPFTYACGFGPDRLVIWGASRAVDLAPGLVARDATGAPVAAPALSGRPLLISGPGAGQMAGVTLGPQRVLADSFDQFAYPVSGAARPAGDGFARFARQEGRRIPLVTRPGQERMSEAWTPHRGAASDRALFLDATTLMPGGWPAAPTAIVHRHEPPRAQRARLRLRLAPAARSADGVRLRVTLGEATLLDRAVTGPLETELPGLALAPGTPLEIAVGPNGTVDGDVTAYRFTLLQE